MFYFHSVHSKFSKDVMEAKEKIHRKCQYKPNAQGIIFVVDMLFVGKSGNPGGTDIDAANVSTTFSKELNFAVYSGEDLDCAELACLVQAAAEFDKYPLNYDFIAFYYTGHGGIDASSREFVLPLQLEGDDGLNVLYIEDDILSPFRSNSLGFCSHKDRKCLFFFDCCLDNKPALSIHGTPLQNKDFNLKNPPACLVAYATSVNHESKGNEINGGLWTCHLCQNLRSTDPLSTILERTIDDVVKAQEKNTKKDQVTYQRPHYVSDVGLVYLKGIAKSSDISVIYYTCKLPVITNYVSTH